MPIVTIQLTREGTQPGADRTTPAQKAALYAGISALIEQVLGKPPEWTWIVFQEVEMADWGWGGMPVAEYRKQLAGPHPPTAG